jgi:hypothetical protein
VQALRLEPVGLVPMHPTQQVHGTERGKARPLQRGGTGPAIFLQVARVPTPSLCQEIKVERS